MFLTIPSACFGISPGQFFLSKFDLEKTKKSFFLLNSRLSHHIDFQLEKGSGKKYKGQQKEKSLEKKKWAGRE